MSRSGPTPPSRRLHLIHRFYAGEDIRSPLAGQEFDELPDVSQEAGTVERIDHRKAADPPVFPPIGEAVAALPSPKPSR